MANHLSHSRQCYAGAITNTDPARQRHAYHYPQQPDAHFCSYCNPGDNYRLERRVL